MSTTATYSVITNGEILPGFEYVQAHQAFSTLFKISPEKATSLLTGKRILKKEIDIDTARLYKKRLENIGIKVTLKEHLLHPDTNLALSLVPTDEEISAQTETSSPVPAADSISDTNTITCPKCQTQQPVNTEECQHCGVIIHKALNRPEKELTPHQKDQQIMNAEQSPTLVAEESLTGKSLAAGAGAALLGALIWSMIANAFGFELGLIAWGIGGAIGFAVMFTGGSGEKAGIACGVLALIAILGGKYLFFSNIKTELENSLADSTANTQYMYEIEMKALDAYSPEFDEQSLKQFMVEYEYTEQYDTGEVTQNEIINFKEVEAPRLNDFYYDKPTFDDWYEITINSAFDEISIMDLVAESLGIVDIIFLLLGVGTAFRLGRGNLS